MNYFLKFLHASTNTDVFPHIFDIILPRIFLLDYKIPIARKLIQPYYPYGSHHQYSILALGYLLL